MFTPPAGCNLGQPVVPVTPPVEAPKPTEEEIRARVLEDVRQAAWSHARAVQRATAADEPTPYHLVQEVITAGRQLDHAVGRALKSFTIAELEGIENLHPSYLVEIQRGGPLI